jgi:hypothetical protein
MIVHLIYIYKKKKQSGQIEGQKTKVEHLACKSSPYAWPFFFFIGRMIVHLIKTKTKKKNKVDKMSPAMVDEALST